ncbi:Uncharacterized protein FWK35_00017306 [Aphis craccivora]|uniref:Uncharacterized protein n=1 Tax=Aphis craccivora TaxID=307492 RepID=A0A6G0Y6S7_APHCR|nr:Uncharacterized protein FWK35_00017306 [Aphis craccivora]
MEQLLDTKLAKLEKWIVKGLVNPSGITPNVATKQATNIVIEEYNLYIPILNMLPLFGVLTTLLLYNAWNRYKTLFYVSFLINRPSHSSYDARPSSPVKSFHDKCTNLQIKQCTEWRCPMHSTFAVLIKESRYTYWTKGDTVRCCTNGRKRSTQPKPYVLPSCWPTLMPSDMEKLNMQFSKL